MHFRTLSRDPFRPYWSPSARGAHSGTIDAHITVAQWQGHHHLRRHRVDPHPFDVALLARHAERHCRLCARSRRSGRRDTPSPRPRPRHRPARPAAGGFRAVPRTHQAGHQCHREPHKRRQPLHEDRRAHPAVRPLQAGTRVAEHGVDEFRPVPDAEPAQDLRARMGAAASGEHPRPASFATPSRISSSQ